MEAYDATQTAPQATASSAADRKLGLALLIIATAQFMLVLDDTIVNVALHSIQRSLQLPTAHLNWVASFYALTFGGLLLAGGRAGSTAGCACSGSAWSCSRWRQWPAASPRTGRP
jgi:MFS family permease